MRRAGTALSLPTLAALGALVAAAAPAMAQSATSTVTTNLSGGQLSISASASASYSFSLAGTDQSQVTTVDLAPDDDTGTGDGWSISVSATPLETSGGTIISSAWQVGLNGSTTSASATTALVASANGTGTYTPPSGNTATYPLAVPGVYGGPSPTPATVYTAAAGSGLGNFAIPVELWVTVPANALAGTYTSTVTWTIAAGPTSSTAGALSTQVLVPATNYQGYTWAVPVTLSSSPAWYNSAPLSEVVNDQQNSAGWTSDTADTGPPASCTDPNAVWVQVAWQQATQLQDVYAYLAANPADQQTVYICVSSNGGSTWTEAAPVSAKISLPPTLVTVPVPTGSYNAIKVFVQSNPNWPSYYQITVQP